MKVENVARKRIMYIPPYESDHYILKIVVYIYYGIYINTYLSRFNAMTCSDCFRLEFVLHI